ncbi:MAG: right-handed parallel beta-helix repeat-containing protein [Thermoplasmata archaeon]|nr:right-handed parallel beta-helix repeat-containing protein [Thermoplasmata archaeon]
MKRISMWKAVIAVVVALAFVLPGSAAFANVGTIKVTSSSKNTVDINNNIGGTIMSDTPRDDTILTEKTVVPAVLLTRGTVYVDDNALPEWYNATHVKTIQEGVTNATAGDTVYVYNGTYFEKVNVTKRVSLVGESRDNVIVNGSGTGNVFIITTPVTNVNISTFTITNGQYGIQIYKSSNNSITNCNVYKHTSGGIYVYSTSKNNKITNCNTYKNTGHGISISTSSNQNNITNCNTYNNTNTGITITGGSNNNIITNCNIYNNSGQYSGQGINIAGSINNSLRNCNVYRNNNYGIVTASNSLDTSITSCNVYNQITYYGIYFQGSRRNNVTNCDVYNNKQYAFYFGSSSYNKFRGNTIHDNVGDLYFDGTTVAHFTHDIDPTNMIQGKRIYYFMGLSNLEYNETTAPNMGYLGLISCKNITVKNADVSGILVINTTYSTILNVDSHNGVNGISLRLGANNNTITSCDAYNNAAYGIYLASASYNKIMNCNVYNNRYYGISLASSSKNNSITNCTVNNTISYYGIYLSSSSNNKITNCNVYNNKQYGIRISSSTNNNLSGNTIYNNGYNFGVDGSTVVHFTHVIDATNTVNGKHIYYLLNAKNITLDETNNIGYLGLISCTNITAKNADVNGILVINTAYSTILNVSSHNAANGIYLAIGSNNINIASCDVYNADYGIYISSLHLTAHNTIINCNAYNNTYHGIYLAQSKYNNITNCNAYNNKNHGIYLYGSSNYNNVTNCNVYNNAQHGIYVLGCLYNKITNCDVYNQITLYGINIYGSSNKNNITNCNVHNNNYGIYIYSTSNNNNITNCNVYSNTLYGIYLKTTSNGNWILHNNFVNTVNSYDICSNKWNDSYPSGGNYWSNYTGVDNYNGPGQNISGSDGIGDTPYNISGGSNKDRYPLMNPLDVIPPVITAVQATPAVQNTTAPVNITCTVTDNWNLVDTVKINITGPGGFTLEATMNEGSYYYEDTYTTIGMYFYYIRATDTSGNVAVSDTYSFVIRTEVETPTSAVNPLPTWKKVVPFAVTATAYDNTGVANVTLWSRYSANGISWTAWTSYGTDFAAPWSWLFTGVDGYYQFYSIAVDTQSNVEAPPSSADASTGIDTVKPVTTIGLSGTMGSNGWYVSNVMVTLSATDTLSGVESTWYKVDAGYWTIYIAPLPFTVSGDGMHTVQYYSFDHAGNQEAAKSVSFKIDTAAPTTTHTLQGLLGSQGWYVTNVTVTLSASDATSGVNYTKYKLNTGNWIVYTGSFVVTTNGNYTLYYCSVDFAGNTEATKQAAFRIQHDVLPPVTTHEFDGVMGENNWFISAVTVTLSAVDDSAGVASTKYKLDAGPLWTTYTGAFPVTEDAEHTLYYYSVDKVGNREENKSATLKIDRTPPTIDLTATAQNLLKTEWLLVANVSDNTSGVAKVEFYVDGEFIGEDAEAPYELEYSGTGPTAQAIVYDNAGNNAISAEVKDQAAPDSQSQSSMLTLVSVSKDTIQGQSISSTLQRLFNLR